jgi:hypothetical protein
MPYRTEAPAPDGAEIWSPRDRDARAYDFLADVMFAAAKQLGPDSAAAREIVVLARQWRAKAVQMRGGEVIPLRAGRADRAGTVR